MVERLYAPWREEYILGPKAEGCIFCEPETREHVAELILHRGTTCYVVLNRYPYNSGHLMVVPYRHMGVLEELDEKERGEMMGLIVLASRVLNAEMKPEGINVGMNLGRAAGAGIADHIHAHLVPRWVGDTNFMPAIFETRVASVDLEKICSRLRAAFEKETSSTETTE